MSRSRKKTPCTKDNTTWGKLESSRRLRRCHKVQLRVAITQDSFENLILKLPDELINKYDICDWRYFIKPGHWFYEGREYRVFMK